MQAYSRKRLVRARDSTVFKTSYCFRWSAGSFLPKNEKHHQAFPKGSNTQFILCMKNFCNQSPNTTKPIQISPFMNVMLIRSAPNHSTTALVDVPGK